MKCAHKAYEFYARCATIYILKCIEMKYNMFLLYKQ